MPTMTIQRSEPLSDTRSPVSPEILYPSTNGHPEQSKNGLRLASDTRRILIADDKLGTLKLLYRMAVCLGLYPTTAMNAVDALGFLKKTRYDLVITNPNMPSSDGDQLADKIKKEYTGTKVIILSGHGEGDMTDRLEGANVMDGLLLKPFNMKTLKEKIELAGCPLSGTWST